MVIIKFNVKFMSDGYFIIYIHINYYIGYIITYKLKEF